VAAAFVRAVAGSAASWPAREDASRRSRDVVSRDGLRELAGGRRHRVLTGAERLAALSRRRAGAGAAGAAVRAPGRGAPGRQTARRAETGEPRWSRRAGAPAARHRSSAHTQRASASIPSTDADAEAGAARGRRSRTRAPSARGDPASATVPHAFPHFRRRTCRSGSSAPSPSEAACLPHVGGPPSGGTSRRPASGADTWRPALSHAVKPIPHALGELRARRCGSRSDTRGAPFAARAGRASAAATAVRGGTQSGSSGVDEPVAVVVEAVVAGLALRDAVAGRGRAAVQGTPSASAVQHEALGQDAPRALGAPYRSAPVALKMMPGRRQREGQPCCTPRSRTCGRSASRRRRPGGTETRRRSSVRSRSRRRSRACRRRGRRRRPRSCRRSPRSCPRRRSDVPNSTSKSPSIVKPCREPGLEIEWCDCPAADDERRPAKRGRRRPSEPVSRSNTGRRIRGTTILTAPGAPSPCGTPRLPAGCRSGRGSPGELPRSWGRGRIGAPRGEPSEPTTPVGGSRW
jgi:hypothetical protein